MPNEVIQKQNERKYLDLHGLQNLWTRIAELYPRTTNLSTILDSLNDPYVHKSVYDGDIARLEEQIASTTGNAMDGDTIWYNPDTKQFQTNLIMDLDTEKKTLRLVTRDRTVTDIEQAKTIISEIDYTPFVKDGMLKSATIVVIPDDEEATQARPAGTYIKFVFNTDAGNEAIYLNVNELNIYQGSQYISIQNDIVSLNTVALDAHIEEYLSESSVVINGIVSRLEGHDTVIQTLQSSIGAFDIRLTNLETSFGGIQTGFQQLTEKVATYDTRFEDIEEVLEIVPKIPISDEDINNLI